MLTGDWGGTRTELANKGYTFDPLWTHIYMDPVAGNFNTSGKSYGKAELFFDANGAKAGWGFPLGVHAHLEYRYGDTILGVASTINPIVVSNLTPGPKGSVFAITGLNFTAPLSKNVRAQIGKINLLDVGKDTPYRGGRGIDRFLNAAFTGPVIQARVIPTITLGGIFNYIGKIGEGRPAITTLGIFDVTASNTTTGLDHPFDKGVSLMGGLLLPGTKPGMGTHNLTLFYSTKDRASLNDIPNVILPPLQDAEKRKRSWVFVYDYSQPLAKKWGWFGNIALSDGKINAYRIAANIGVGGDGVFTSRPHDKFGAGLFYTNPSRDVQDLLKPLFATQDEFGSEIFYDFAVTDWFRIGPDFQVIEPIRKNANTVVVIGVRGQLRF